MTILAMNRETNEIFKFYNIDHVVTMTKFPEQKEYWTLESDTEEDIDLDKNIWDIYTQII